MDDDETREEKDISLAKENDVVLLLRAIQRRDLCSI
jgi:hypothetical protein